jgi:hypothetical protein
VGSLVEAGFQVSLAVLRFQVFLVRVGLWLRVSFVILAEPLVSLVILAELYFQISFVVLSEGNPSLAGRWIL